MTTHQRHGNVTTPQPQATELKEGLDLLRKGTDQIRGGLDKIRHSMLEYEMDSDAYLAVDIGCTAIVQACSVVWHVTERIRYRFAQALRTPTSAP